VQCTLPSAAPRWPPLAMCATRHNQTCHALAPPLLLSPLLAPTTV
jgi:hypothetical protein